MKRLATAAALAGPSGVVLALQDAEEPQRVLERAHRLARTLQQRLMVVRVLPKNRVCSVVHGVWGSRKAAIRPRDAHEATRGWLRRCLGTPAETIRVVVLGGDFVPAAASCARYIRARLLVMSPDSQKVGRLAIALARASGTQVLVARGEERGSPILAATDLQDPAFRVLRSAAEIAHIFKQRLIAFHNVDPLSVVSGRAVTSTGVMLTGGVPKATRRESLVSVSRSLQIDANPVLGAALDAAQAILDEAEARDAGLIVVGARASPWWRRLTSEHVSARVASQADSAVLVTPIP